MFMKSLSYNAKEDESNSKTNIKTRVQTNHLISQRFFILFGSFHTKIILLYFLISGFGLQVLRIVRQQNVNKTNLKLFSRSNNYQMTMHVPCAVCECLLMYTRKNA